MGGLLRKPSSFSNLAESQLYHFGFALPNKTRHSSSAASSQQRGIHRCCFPLLIDLKLPGKLSPSSLPQREVDTCGTQHPLHYPKPAPCSLQFSPVLQGTRAYGPPGRKDEMFRKGLFPRTAVAEGPCPCPQVLGHCQMLQRAGKSQRPADPQRAASPTCQRVKKPS